RSYVRLRRPSTGRMLPRWYLSPFRAAARLLLWHPTRWHLVRLQPAILPLTSHLLTVPRVLGLLPWRRAQVRRGVLRRKSEGTSPCRSGIPKEPGRLPWLLARFVPGLGQPTIGKVPGRPSTSSAERGQLPWPPGRCRL